MGTPSVSDAPKLYGELASWFHLLSWPADYAEEAEFARTLLVEPNSPPLLTLLELGSGGGMPPFLGVCFFRGICVVRAQLELDCMLQPISAAVEGIASTKAARRNLAQPEPAGA